MVKKTRKPYETATVVLLTVFLVAGLVAPSATGYVNNGSSDFDKDTRAAVVMENAIVRLADRGELKLKDNLTSEKVEAELNGFLGSIPDVSQKGYLFCLNVDTGKVNAKQAKDANEIVINKVSGD